MAGVRQFDEEEALEKALELFWRRGYAQTSMQDLAVATGVLRGSLYNAYGDKAALFLRVFEGYRERFLGAARESLQRPTLKSALQAFFDFVIASMTTGAPTRGCLSSKTALAGDALEPPIRAVLQELLDGLEAALRERFEAAPDGALAVSPAKAARLVVTFTRGLVVVERVYQDARRLRATADALLELLLDPAATRRAPAGSSR